MMCTPLVPGLLSVVAEQRRTGYEKDSLKSPETHKCSSIFKRSNSLSSTQCLLPKAWPINWPAEFLFGEQ